MGPLQFAGTLIFSFVTLVWLLSLVKQDAGIMDIFWGLGFVFTAILVPVRYDAWSSRGILVLALVIIWGIRLSIYIGYRNAGKPEDTRYQRWRLENGSNWWWKSYFKVFLLQGTIMWIVVLPVIFTLTGAGGGEINIIDYLGTTFWLTGMFFEVVGDWQLQRFKADRANKGQILTSGLWHLTRHPNYFGEAVLWWGIYLVAVAAGHPLTIISPLLMTFLLVRVSGVRMLDELMIRSKPGYAEYIKSVNAFLPGLPRR
ncbi:MAG: DUF1295 domain-containing protein [Candidatus Neomarinimicrobiota bacterium]